MTALPADLLQHAAELIEQADGLVIAAGAGMGVDSGLPDFRGNEGFWRAYPALGRAGMSFMQAASPDTFESNPRLAWGFYGHRLALYRRTQPHAGFGILRQWADHMTQGCTVFTSNVDGQFQMAGYDPHPVHECHGSIHHLQCLNGCGDDIWSAEQFEPQIDTERCLLASELPVCPHCGGLARPNILMFGDWGWAEQRSAAQARAQQAWLARVQRPVIVELGAGTAVPSVRHFSQHLVRHAGARLIRINPREPDVPTPFDVGLACGALDGLQAIDSALDKSSG